MGSMDNLKYFFNQIKEMKDAEYRSNPDLKGVADPYVGMETSLGPGEDIINKITGNNLTSAQAITNQYNAVQAQISRNFQERMANTQYQRGVVDMQKAGINPALAMTSGASPAPTPSGAVASAGTNDNGMSFGELVQGLRAIAEIKNLNANTKRTEVMTEGEGLKNQYQSLVNGFYPSLTGETINKIRADIAGVNADIDMKSANAGLVRAKKVLVDAEGKLADELAKAKLALTQEQSEAAKQAAVASAARAAVDSAEAKYMRENNMHMGSSDLVAIATALAGYFDTDIPSVIDGITEGVNDVGRKVVGDLREQRSQRREDRRNVRQNARDEFQDYVSRGRRLGERIRNGFNKLRGK